MDGSGRTLHRERGDTLRCELQAGGPTGYYLNEDANGVLHITFAGADRLFPEHVQYLSAGEGVVKYGTGNGYCLYSVCIERSMQRRASEISLMDMDLLHSHNEVADSGWAGI